MNGKKRPTIKDVARLSGLSVSTVSLVINNNGYVSAETRKKVEKVIEDLAYHPTRSARGLASKTSGNFGFILSDDHFSQAEPFYTKIFLGTEFEARNHNYYVLLTTVGPQFKGTNDVPRFLLERNVDGIIVAGKINAKLIDYIEGLGLHVVLVDYEIPRRRISSVLIDNRAGARAAMLHLISLGHKRIAFAGGDLGHPSIAERFRGYKEVLEETETSFSESLAAVDETDTGIHNGYAAASRLFKHAKAPTAIFAANDAMAIGCIRYAKLNNIRIPDDLAVIGFDDIEMGSHVDPRLSTIRVFKEEMGKIAVQRLVESIGEKNRTIVTTHVPVELVIRESTRKSTKKQPGLAAKEEMHDAKTR